jgi:hypothetical protein
MNGGKDYMLEVSLPEHIIKLFKLTCRNYTYFDDGTLWSIDEYIKGEYNFFHSIFAS